MVDFEKCSLRPGKSFDPVEAYGSKNPTLFILKINHGGFFTLGSPRRYMNGKVNWFDGVDSDEFSIHELSEMLKLLGYKKESMFYHFKIPNSGLDLGLKPLVSDSDVIDMVKQVGSMKVIEVYIELWMSAIDNESMSNPAKMSTIDTDKALSKEMFEQWDRVESDIHNDQIEIIHMQTEIAKEQGVDVVDIGKQGVDVVDIGKEQGVDAVDIGKESKNWPPHIDMTNDFDPFFSVLNTNNKPRVVFEKGESSMPNIGEDEDVLVDEDNILKDVHVDMGQFRRKYNKNVEWEGFTKHQIENNDDFEDEELNLEDFYSETDCEGDVEADRNKALRKLAKQQLF
ncbi:hypothetical protein Tco_0873366, partial [Tanacetum coccineum]